MITSNKKRKRKKKYGASIEIKNHVLLFLFLSLTFNSNHRREQHTCYIYIYYKMSKLIYHSSGQNSTKDVYITSTFAHGFDEFVTTRPPSTSSTTIKNEK